MPTLQSYLDQIPDEFAKLEATISQVFTTGQESKLTEDRVQGWIDEMNSGGTGSRAGLTGSALEDQLRDDISEHVITKEVFMSFYGLTAEEAEQVIVGGNEGGLNFGDLTAVGGDSTGSVRGVLAGGTLVEVKRDDGTSYFAISYDVNGSTHLYSFGSEAQAEKASGPLSAATTLTEDEVTDVNSDFHLIGDAAGVTGLEGDYATWFDGIMGEASREAGIRNPGMLGRFAADKDIMKIMAQSQAGDWGDEQTQAEVRRTDFYLNVLYPGIDKILETGIGNPEDAWKSYNNSVEATLASLGYARDEDGSFRSKIGEMLKMGIGDEEFVEASGVFVRAEQSEQFKGILNQWVQDATGKEVTFEEWFDVLAGTSTPELDSIVEKATIQFQAENANIILDPTAIARIAELTQFSEQAVGTAFSSVEQTLLQLGDVGLSRYSLSVQKLVDATLDIGEDAAATRRLAGKTIRELGLADDDKDQFFTGFSQRGAPIKTGLLAAAPEAG